MPPTRRDLAVTSSRSLFILILTQAVQVKNAYLDLSLTVTMSLCTQMYVKLVILHEYILETDSTYTQLPPVLNLPTHETHDLITWVLDVDH